MADGPAAAGRLLHRASPSRPPSRASIPRISSMLVLTDPKRPLLAPLSPHTQIDSRGGADCIGKVTHPGACHAYSAVQAAAY